MRLGRVRAPMSAAILALGSLVAVAGCATSPASARGLSGAQIKALDPDLLPAHILDLSVDVENVTKQLHNAQNSYVDALTLFGLRRGSLLIATFQVSQLTSLARVSNPAFQQAFVASIGGTTPVEVRLGGTDVWLTTGTDEQVSIWFSGRDLLVLSVRNDYGPQRTLIRQLLAVRP